MASLLPIMPDPPGPTFSRMLVRSRRAVASYWCNSISGVPIEPHRKNFAFYPACPFRKLWRSRCCAANHSPPPSVGAGPVPIGLFETGRFGRRNHPPLENKRAFVRDASFPLLPRFLRVGPARGVADDPGRQGLGPGPNGGPVTTGSVGGLLPKMRACSCLRVAYTTSRANCLGDSRGEPTKGPGRWSRPECFGNAQRPALSTRIAKPAI
jgi:hypothetical protein